MFYGDDLKYHRRVAAQTRDVLKSSGTCLRTLSQVQSRCDADSASYYLRFIAHTVCVCMNSTDDNTIRIRSGLVQDGSANAWWGNTRMGAYESVPVLLVVVAYTMGDRDGRLVLRMQIGKQVLQSANWVSWQYLSYSARVLTDVDPHVFVLLVVLLNSFAFSSAW